MAKSKREPKKAEPAPPLSAWRKGKEITCPKCGDKGNVPADIPEERLYCECWKCSAHVYGTLGSEGARKVASVKQGEGLPDKLHLPNPKEQPGLFG